MVLGQVGVKILGAAPVRLRRLSREEVVSSKWTDKGVLVKWEPDRGYGFVITTSGEEIFAHASEFMDLKTVGPPEIGQRLRFSVIIDRGKKRMVRAVREDHRRSCVTWMGRRPKPSDEGPL